MSEVFLGMIPAETQEFTKSVKLYVIEFYPFFRLAV